MKKEASIMIVGPIGSFKMNGKQVNGIQLVDIVAKVNALPPEVNTIRFLFDTLGGNSKTGDHMYDYIVSLKSNYEIIHEQIGIIGSIGTKIWFAADRRIATIGQDMFIHNPWIPNMSGDSDDMLEAHVELKALEENMAMFYSMHTGIPIEGIRPLMKAETTFPAEQALELKFATEIQKALNIAAYKMKKSTSQKFNELVVALKKVFSDEDVLNMVVELDGGTKIAFATEDPANLVGVQAFTVDEAGAQTQVPAPDGPYKLKDGRTVTVAGGVVTAVTPAVAPPAAPAAPAAAPVAAPPAPTSPPPVASAEEEGELVTKMDELIVAIKQGNKANQEAIMKAVDEKITAFKNEVKTVHVPLGYQSVKQIELAAEWDRSFKANEHVAMKKTNLEHWKTLYYAKYGKMPNV